jgi:hypothetical protein
VRLLCPHCHPPDGLWFLIRYLTFYIKQIINDYRPCSPIL